MRTFYYWLTSTAIAVLAASASEQGDGPVGMVWTAGSRIDVLPVPEPSRAILLALGILAIAFTYRRAWLNLKGGN